MNIDRFGRVELTEDEIFSGLYSKKVTSLSNIHTDKETAAQFNNSVKSNNDHFEPLSYLEEINSSLEEFDSKNQLLWFMPENYKSLDIEKILLDLCPKENIDRLKLELDLFRKHNMMNVLRYLKYLIDTMREKNLVWGVGRGSSVASYALFLLGIHKIDSIKYNLDISEFLK